MQEDRVLGREYQLPLPAVSSVKHSPQPWNCVYLVEHRRDCLGIVHRNRCEIVIRKLSVQMLRLAGNLRQLAAGSQSPSRQDTLFVIRIA